jgi:hypothetical protein
MRREKIEQYLKLSASLVSDISWRWKRRRRHDAKTTTVKLTYSEPDFMSCPRKYISKRRMIEAPMVVLPHAVLDRLKDLRGPGESYSDCHTEAGEGVRVRGASKKPT